MKHDDPINRMMLAQDHLDELARKFAPLPSPLGGNLHVYQEREQWHVWLNADTTFDGISLASGCDTQRGAIIRAATVLSEAINVLREHLARRVVDGRTILPRPPAL